MITIYNAILFFFLELNEKSFAKKTTSNFSSDTLKIHFRKFTAASAFTVSEVLNKVLATIVKLGSWSISNLNLKTQKKDQS